MPKNSLSKLQLIEGLILTSPLIWFFENKIGNQSDPPEMIINLTFLMLLLTLFVFRNSNLRHMYFAFGFLILSVIGNIFRFDNFAYLSGSLVISLLILGTLNMLLFKTNEEVN